MRRLPPWPQLATLAVFALSLGYLAWLGWGMLPQNAKDDRGFNGERAMSWAQAQCDIGPRPAGSDAIALTGEMIIKQLEDRGWKTRVQAFEYRGLALRNIVAMAGDAGDGEPLLIIATHYDTRQRSDRDPDPDKRTEPTLGANDGASGASVLLELARALDKERLQHQVWLAFLDGEANAGLPDWAMGVGAGKLLEAVQPDAFIYLNLVGGENAHFPRTAPAADLLQEQLWSAAARLRMNDIFVDEKGPAIEDAHAVFLNAGVPSVGILQPDYPYFRTTRDDCKRLDKASLHAVGALLEFYLEDGSFLTVAPALK
ncbi:MAG TPA: M28 family peptidase [Anaerolineae bacterium]|nr:M28 family peptidase [Anaerolineae bacterium]